MWTLLGSAYLTVATIYFVAMLLDAQENVHETSDKIVCSCLSLLWPVVLLMYVCFPGEG